MCCIASKHDAEKMNELKNYMSERKSNEQFERKSKTCSDPKSDKAKEREQ